MKKYFLIILIWSTLSVAGEKEFCEGFKEGYKAIKGDMALVPLCPLAPLTPIGSTDFREGIKAGMKAAKEK